MAVINFFFNLIELIIVGICNKFYNLGLFIYEFLIFGFNLWWWKIKFYYFLQYFLISYYSLIQKESTSFQYDKDNFIYGETPCITIREILKEVGAKPEDIFIDLGCGRGITVFYARYLMNLRAKGYELIPTFIQKANKIKKIMDTEKVEFINDDLLEADISKAKIIYIAGTTFSEDFIRKLQKKLRQAPKGSYVVTLSYSLSKLGFTFLKKKRLYFTWGKNTVYFHKRK